VKSVPHLLSHDSFYVPISSPDLFPRENLFRPLVPPLVFFSGRSFSFQFFRTTLPKQVFSCKGDDVFPPFSLAARWRFYLSRLLKEKATKVPQRTVFFHMYVFYAQIFPPGRTHLTPSPPACSFFSSVLQTGPEGFLSDFADDGLLLCTDLFSPRYLCTNRTSFS